MTTPQEPGSGGTGPEGPGPGHGGYTGPAYGGGATERDASSGSGGRASDGGYGGGTPSPAAPAEPDRPAEPDPRPEPVWAARSEPVPEPDPAPQPDSGPPPGREAAPEPAADPVPPVHTAPSTAPAPTEPAATGSAASGRDAAPGAGPAYRADPGPDSRAGLADDPDATQAMPVVTPPAADSGATAATKPWSHLADAAAAAAAPATPPAPPTPTPTPTPPPTPPTPPVPDLGPATGPATRAKPAAKAEPKANPAAAQPLKTGKVRRARLVIRRVDPWSVLKFSLLFSLCLLIVFVVAVAALYYALDSLGVFDSVNQFVREVTQSGPEGRPTGGFDITFSAGKVIGGAAVLGAINVVIITAISTLGAFLYNLCSDIVGGIEVTLAERD